MSLLTPRGEIDFSHYCHRDMYNDTRFLSKTQLIMINQSNAGRFDPKVFVNCVQETKTFGSKRPAFD